MSDQPTWWNIGADDVVTVDLPDEQRELMIRALLEWGGPSRPTDLIARAMGFASAEALHLEGARLRAALREGKPMSKRDWARALVATEIVFASSYYGAGCDWAIVTGWSDDRTLSMLRSLQRTLGGLRAPPLRKREEDPLADP
jgi:hypothetical protein